MRTSAESPAAAHHKRHSSSAFSATRARSDLLDFAPATTEDMHRTRDRRETTRARSWVQDPLIGALSGCEYSTDKTNRHSQTTGSVHSFPLRKRSRSTASSHCLSGCGEAEHAAATNAELNQGAASCCISFLARCIQKGSTFASWRARPRSRPKTAFAAPA